MKISANIANNLEIIPFFIFIFRYIEISWEMFYLVNIWFDSLEFIRRTENLSVNL